MPYTMTFDETVLVIRFHGELVGADLVSIARELLAFERVVRPVPDRVVDLEAVDVISVDDAAIEALAAERFRHAPANAIRTGIVARMPSAIEAATTFKRLNTHPMVTIRLFEREQAARAWLREPR